MSINEEIDHQLNCVDEDLTKLSIDNQHNNENITSSSAAVVAHSQQQQDEIYSEMDSGFQSRFTNNFFPHKLQISCGESFREKNIFL